MAMGRAVLGSSDGSYDFVRSFGFVFDTLPWMTVHGSCSGRMRYSAEMAMSKSSLLSYSITENVTSSWEMFLQLHGICSPKSALPGLRLAYDDVHRPGLGQQLAPIVRPSDSSETRSL